MQHHLTSRILGYVLSLLFTLAVFWILLRPDHFNLSVTAILAIIFTLAFLQFIVQSICFLYIWGKAGPHWNLVVFLSTLSIIAIIILGSIWIMYHLELHMMMQ